MSSYPHSELRGQHAFLSPSNYHWLRYTPEKLRSVYENKKAVIFGTEMHELAARCIQHGVKLTNNRDTVNLFVNDAIRYRMVPERVLYYSPFCFGTADAISFANGVLRIHDLKTGKSKASMDQLYIYAALYCLQENIDPNSVSIQLRIYQNGSVQLDEPSGDHISNVMMHIVECDRALQTWEAEDVYRC